MTHTDPAGHMAGMSTSRPPKPGQSLAEKFPTVTAQWHPTRNGDRTPDQVSAGSEKKAWWRCEEGHEWEAAVNNRTTKGAGCPVCSGRQVLTGYNDLATRFPDIAAQWHPTENGDLTPNQVSAGMNAKVWWRCDEGHQWEASVNHRTFQGTGCPVHARQKVRVGFRNLASRFPLVAAQWHPTRNGDHTPDQVLAGTNAKVWWQCGQGHVWEARVCSRTSNGSGCPVCSGRTVLTGFNDLATRSPNVAAQWHPTRNGDLRPDQMSAGTNAKAWWRCGEGHEWEAQVGNRTYQGTGCPVCARR